MKLRFQKVLLATTPTSSYLGAARPPQNLGYLAQALLENKIIYDVLDMRLGYPIKILIRKITNFKPDLIGFSLVSLEYKKSYQLISEIKNRFPHIKIIVGGPHVTVLKENVLTECEAIDYGVVHEGEETLVEFCQDLVPIEKVKGLIWRNHEKIISNGIRRLSASIDHISFPTYKHFEIHKYIPEMPFNSSRGCPYQCVFCPNKIITKRFRWRTAQNVVDEIEFWYKKGYRTFNYDDDNFTFHNDRVYAICDEIEKRGIINAEFRCSNGLRADRVNRDLLQRMREVGFGYIAFGIDGGNDRMLKINKKGETLDQIKQAISDACDLGFDVKVFIITCMPFETLEDVEDSISLALKYPIKRVILNNPIPYPGTELFETVKANRWFIRQPEDYLNNVTENEDDPVFETPEISKEQRIRILKRIRRIEKRVTRMAIRRMYKKYIGLNIIAGYLFSTNYIQKQFFKNITFRRWMEMIRYKRMLKKQV